jgi:hypothetical protein
MALLAEDERNFESPREVQRAVEELERRGDYARACKIVR